MSSACRDALLLAMIACVHAGCERETRAFAHPGEKVWLFNRHTPNRLGIRQLGLNVCRPLHVTHFSITTAPRKNLLSFQETSWK